MDVRITLPYVSHSSIRNQETQQQCSQECCSRGFMRYISHLNEIDMLWYLHRCKDPVLEVAEVPHWRCTEVRCNQCRPSPPRRVGGRSTKDTPPSHKSHRHKLFTWLPIKPPKSTSQVINRSHSLPSDSFCYSGWKLGFPTVRRTYLLSYWNFTMTC